MENNNKSKRLIRYGMYCNFIKEIKHFDNLQTYFRLLSSTMLLSVLGGIGFLFSITNLNIPFSRIYPAILLAIIGITSIIILWHIDLKFYEKLLVSNFAEAYRLEKENKWLPKPHHKMLFGTHKKDHPSNVAYYYIGCVNTIVITIGLIVSYYYYSMYNELIISIIIVIITIFVIIFFYWFIKKRTKKIIDLMKEIKYLE